MAFALHYRKVLSNFWVFKDRDLWLFRSFYFLSLCYGGIWSLLLTYAFPRVCDGWHSWFGVRVQAWFVVGVTWAWTMSRQRIIEWDICYSPGHFLLVMVLL